MNKLLNKTTFIVGNKKNSGKTTFLNAALARLRGKGSLAYLSIGVDGEMNDQIFGFSKPRVHACPGDYVVTLDHALKYTVARFKVLKTFPYKTVLGRPKLICITCPGDIEIIGPENNTQLAKILKYLHARMKIKTVLVDGAINRITQVASFKDAQFVFVCRVDPGRVSSAAEEVKRMMELSNVPCHPLCRLSFPRKRESRACTRDPRFRRDDMLFLSGALTPAKAARIPATANKVSIEDFTKVFLNYRELVKFRRGHKLYFKYAFKLARVVVNLFGADKAIFLKELADKKIVSKIKVNSI